MTKILPDASDPSEVEDLLWEGFTPGIHVAYDVGSNGGQLFYRMQRLAEEIHAFEPATESFEHLEYHFGTREGFVLNNKAVSSHTGLLHLAETSRLETGQLVTPGTEGMDWSEEAQNAPLRAVEAVSLDDYAYATGKYPRFIKIDVEGHELEVLNGASGILQISIPEMLIEIHSESLGEQIEELLTSLGYRLDIVRHPHYAEGTTLWKTHFWIKAKSPFTKA